MEDALFPFLRRHQAGIFAGKIDAGLAAQAEFRGVVRDAIDAQPLADVVEVDVAGIHDGFVQIHLAVAAFSAS